MNAGPRSDADVTILRSALRSAGDLAGVFEFDGETSYFYLYRVETDREEVLEALHVFSGKPDFRDQDISIRWNAEEDKVGLFIRAELWAVFDARNRLKYGGDYRAGTTPILPAEATRDFELAS